jgi:uncharacterized protein
MSQPGTIDGKLLARMIRAGVENLRSHVKSVNDLNVFPIPDGDTGDNMLLTSIGGMEKVDTHCSSVSDMSHSVSDGMLLSARGNSGVILSQIFEGMAAALEGIENADSAALVKALKSGTKFAYEAVMTPTEGTMLTVMRCATEYVEGKEYSSPMDVLADFLEEARRTLDRTPSMLPVLRKAGVVDSGGAGLVYIVEGMLRGAFSDEDTEDDDDESFEFQAPGQQNLDLDLFTEDSELEYGYCTELLVRLQRAKVDIDSFDVNVILDYLREIGNSVVTVKRGSIVKIHVHTKTPDKVLAFCQQYGEFLKIKIENMSLQHSNTELPDTSDSAPSVERTERRKYGVVAVASGDGIQQMFRDSGADEIVDGGQSMNPSTGSFLAAFTKVNADTVFVLPNNSNILLTAKLAAGMYKFSDVRVIESKNTGEGYAALSVYSGEEDSADEIVEEMNDAMKASVTAAVSRSIRNAEGVREGEYIGFRGKDILTCRPSRSDAVLDTLSSLPIEDSDIVIVIYGGAVESTEAETVEKEILSRYKGKEVYLVDGKQEIYDYILILE